MKKIGKIIILVLVLALCLLTPGTPVTVNTALKLTPAENETTQFVAPTQSGNVFNTEAVDTYDLASWTKPSNNYLVAQQVTPENNGIFHETYPNTTLSNANIVNRSPYVITTSTLNMPARGCYTTNAITLPANGYYLIEVEYCLQEQQDKNGVSNNTTNTHAFGTFYLNDNAISLQETGWHYKAFYVQTDVLEAANVTPELYLGARDQDALGAIYFNKFTVTAISQDKFQATVFNGNTLKVNPNSYLNFSKADRDYVAINGNFSNAKFTGITNSYAVSLNEIGTVNIPAYLGFNDQQAYFYPQQGNHGEVMLMCANNSNATLTLQDYTFKPKPHEVYMFQFYSIATAAENFNGFYLTLTPNNGTDKQIAEQVANLTTYPYHNGWQLNTVFFIAGHDLNQAYTIGFSLASADSKTTGWVCVDDLKIYRVNGSYATNNATAVGVHDTNDLNQSTETLNLANGYFELGTAADTVNLPTSGYPYPLKANDWTSSSTENGIINLDATLWNESFGENHPATINGYDANNNVYMMHNTTTIRNTLTSPAISTTAGESTYVSFDACSKNSTATVARIITATTDENGNLTDIIYLGDSIKINANEWQHYEFEIKEDTNAVSRSYYLQFEMNAIGYAYIDNVRLEQFGTADEIGSVDLNNPLAINGIWRSTDETLAPYIHATKDGLTIENTNGKKTVVQNDFAYNLTADKYYELIITTRGNNAYLGLQGYDGLMKVTTDELNPTLTYNYKLYVKVTEATTANLQITLGSIANDESANNTNGKIFISDIKVNTIEEVDYNDAKELASNNASMLILTPTAATEDNHKDTNTTVDNSFFGENWWFLVPTLITAIALFLAIATFLFRKVKFEKHITKKHTSYARDMRLKNQQNKIVAQKAAKVDNVTDETKGN